MSAHIKIGVITGPTASGKTALAARCAVRLNAEIVCADSIQIYKQLDIGSAKPTEEEMLGVPHHLVDFYYIGDEKFSVARYRALAGECIDGIASRGRLPIVAGGTGLYINSIVYPLDFTATPADEELRRTLSAMEDSEPGKLYKLLEERDPAAAMRLHPNDRKRLIRALEVLENTGESIGEDFINAEEREIPYDPIMIGLTMPREKLYARIDARVDSMMNLGLLDEVDTLIKNGYDPSLSALQGLGYKQLLEYRRGETTLDQAVEKIKRETRRFSKRQLTWFRRDKRIHWLDMDELGMDAAVDIACELLTVEE